MLFLGKFDSKRQNYLIKMKLGAETASDMLNLMEMFILNWRYTFGENLVQKIKIVHFFTILL